MPNKAEVSVVIKKVEKLIYKLEILEKQGSESASLFAEGMRFRLSRLRQASANNDKGELSNVFNDIVPTPKDLDAIDFKLNDQPEIRELSAEIRIYSLDCM